MTTSRGCVAHSIQTRTSTFPSPHLLTSGSRERRSRLWFSLCVAFRNSLSHLPAQMLVLPPFVTHFNNQIFPELIVGCWYPAGGYRAGQASLQGRLGFATPTSSQTQVTLYFALCIDLCCSLDSTPLPLYSFSGHSSGEIPH